MSVKLQVIVVEAQNLLAKDTYKDREDSSDPFVRLRHGKTKLVTTVHRETLNPVWEETFKFDIDKADAFLILEVWDKDKLMDDFLGKARVALAEVSDGREHDRWFELLDKAEKKPTRGRLRLKFKALTPSAAAGSAGAGTAAAADGGDVGGDGDADGAGVEGGGAAAGAASDAGAVGALRNAAGKALNVLTVKVKEARNLGSPKYDAFCLVVHGTQNQQTLVIDDNMHPKWNEQFVFDVQTADPFVVFEIYDKELLAKDKFLGQVTLDLADYTDCEVHDEWHALAPKAGDSMAKRLLKGQFRKQGTSGELRVEVSLEHRAAGIAGYERSTFIAKSTVDQNIFEGVFFLMLVLVVVILKLVYDI